MADYKYTIRLLSGGVSSADKDNEHDKYIADPNGPVGNSNEVWNWKNMWSWTSSTSSFYASSVRVIRGYYASNRWGVPIVSGAPQTTSWEHPHCGFRPVLLIESTYKIKYLFEDNGEVKKYDSVNNLWISLGSAPATESMFLTDGMDDLSIIDNNALQQLENDTPKLLMYTDDPNKTSAFVNLTAVPHSQLIFQEGDIDVSTGVENLSVNSTVQNASTLKIIASADGGVTWKTFDGVEWQIITDDASQVKVNGMTPDVVNGLTKTQIDDLLQGSNTLRFAYYLEQDQLNDKINIDDITITALPTATETPTLDSIKIVYDELTIEGRMQDLEKINAINMAKLQFKSNVLLQSEKYKLHDLVVDTFESLSGIDISNTNALYDENHKEFIYDTSDGAPTIQEVILQEETLSDYRKKFMLYVDQEGNIDYEYSLDSGVTWNSIIPFTMIDLTEQTGTKLKVKAKLKDSTAKLRGIAFSWI